MKKPIKLVYLFWSWSESVSWTWEPDQSDSWMVFKWSWLNGWSSTQITLNSSFTNWTDQVLVFNWIWPERFLLTQLTAQELYQIRERIIQFCILYWSLTYVVTIHELSLNTRKTYMKTLQNIKCLSHWRKAVWNGMIMKINYMFWVNYSFNGIGEVHLI